MLGEPCLHFAGLHEKACNKGVLYESVCGTDPNVAIAQQLPCFANNKGTPKCALRDLPSKAAVKKREREVAKRVAEKRKEFGADT